MTTRRDFLTTVAGTAAVALTGGGHLLRSAAAQSGGANEKLKFAVVGVGGRGKSHIAGLLKDGGVVITHIVDVDRAIGERTVEDVAKKQGTRPEFVVDFRDVLDPDLIDGVAIATPNHVHALQVRLELPPRDAGDLGTDAAEILLFTAGSDLIAELCALTADFALPRHG